MLNKKPSMGGIWIFSGTAQSGLPKSETGLPKRSATKIKANNYRPLVTGTSSHN